MPARIVNPYIAAAEDAKSNASQSNPVSLIDPKPEDFVSLAIVFH